MRYIKRITIAIIIASTLFLNASLNREAASVEEAGEGDAPPPDYIDTTYAVPSLADASQTITDGIKARLEAERVEAERLVAIERERKAAEAKAAEAEAKRLVALEVEREAARERKAKAAAVANKPTEPSRSNSERTGAGQAFTATFYTAYCNTGCTGVTATGLDVSNTIYTPEGLRIVAVDPSQIPLGSLVQVTLADGAVFNASAADTGGAIKGRIVDVLVASKDEARRLGRQDIRVHILRKGR